MFLCKHNWQLISEVTTQSRFELLTVNKYDVTKFNNSLLIRKVIQLVACSKCGKLKKFVETI